ncbi:MAG: hypothetical protein QM597_01560 [Aeromicrobium sp.]|uniref:hypothetical protein n=1 Tax=Aeromicrobium sp. TaxID=1871063 RepID=UPI0039E316B8
MSSTSLPPAASPEPMPLFDPPKVRRFGAARASGLALAALIGGYLGHLALEELITAFRERDFSAYDMFGDEAAIARAHVLALLAELIGAVAGLIAVIGIAARRWAVGILLLTLVSMACYGGFIAQILDTALRTDFLQPSEYWSASRGLPVAATLLALQLVVVVLCLIRGPKPPAPAVPVAPAAEAQEEATTSWDFFAVDEALGEEQGETPAVASDSEEDTDAGESEDDEGNEGDVFLVIHDHEYGPYPPERVRGFLVEGRIHQGTLVRIGDEVRPASEVPSIYGDDAPA